MSRFSELKYMLDVASSGDVETRTGPGVLHTYTGNTGPPMAIRLL
jgi:hypothetical protein